MKKLPYIVVEAVHRIAMEKSLALNPSLGHPALKHVLLITKVCAHKMFIFLTSLK